MGGDGGVVATQRKFVRGCKDPTGEDESKNVKKHQRMRTQVCAQSSVPLNGPIVGCEMGNLYDKEEMLKALIDKRLNEKFSHIRGLRDVKTLVFQPNPAYDSSNELEGECPSKFICPVTRTEFTGSHPFVFIWPSGAVLSERAVKEIGIEGLQAEFGPFHALDVIKLIPLEEEFSVQNQQMRERRSLLKQEKKKDGKRKRDAPADTEATTNCLEGDEPQKGEKKGAKHHSKEHSTMVAKVPAQTKVRVSDGKAISSTSSLAKEAVKRVEQQEEKSGVFKKLFHKGHDADKHDRDLFMSVAGMRYTLS